MHGNKMGMHKMAGDGDGSGLKDRHGRCDDRGYCAEGAFSAVRHGQFENRQQDHVAPAHQQAMSPLKPPPELRVLGRRGKLTL